MDNNDILKKLRVALKLRDDEIVEIMKLVDFRITTTELGAFFRKSDHPNYKECGDQVLRNFLNGLIIHLRGPMERKEPKDEAPKPANNAASKPKPKRVPLKKDLKRNDKPTDKKRS
jgi:Uncharacterized protein conserved in bacteria